MQTVPFPVASLHKLDPVVPKDEEITVLVGAKESCDNLSQNPFLESTANISVSRNDSVASLNKTEDLLPTEPYANRVRSLERNLRGTLSTLEKAPIRMGSLERNARGSLSHRGSLVPVAPFTRQHSIPASPPPRSRRDQDVGQFSVQGTLNTQLAASVMNKMRNQPEPPLVEEIYDFGGENVKSCVSIAAQKAGNKFRPSMSASHPTSYNVPVGIVQGVPYQSPIQKVITKGYSSQGYYPQRSASPLGYQQVYSAQPMMYRAQATPQNAGFQSPARTQFTSASSIDSASLYATRQECSSVVQPVAQSGQPVSQSNNQFEMAFQSNQMTSQAQVNLKFKWHGLSFCRYFFCVS